MSMLLQVVRPRHRYFGFDRWKEILTMRLFKVFAALFLLCSGLTVSKVCAQAIPTGDQLDQLVAPIALYPDTLLAQICAASTDPQQIVDANNWLKQNKSL
jgi:hypothetical protein